MAQIVSQIKFTFDVGNLFFLGAHLIAQWKRRRELTPPEIQPPTIRLLPEIMEYE